jgi:ABC-2 type transport system permease protein
VLFVVSVFLAIVVSFGFRFLYNSASFWLVDFRGVMTMALVVSLFFSGMIMPLQFFPHWLGTIARVLPFSSVVQTPIDVYLGRHSDPTLLALIAEQVGWALTLIGLGRLALRAGTRKLVVQGG